MELPTCGNSGGGAFPIRISIDERRA